MTEKYPRIKEIGLDLKCVYGTFVYYVRADDIEAKLQEGIEMYGYPYANKWLIGMFQRDEDTHRFLAIPLGPIVKEDTREAKIKALQEQVESILKEIEALR